MPDASQGAPRPVATGTGYNDPMDILYPYAPAPGPGTATVDAAHRVTALTAQRGWPVTRLACVGETTYETAVRAAWQRGAPFAIVEHDIGVTGAALDGLAACAHPVCAVAYPLTHLAGPSAALAALVARVEADPEWGAAAVPPLWRDAAQLARTLPAPRPGVMAYQTWAHRVTTPDGWRWAETGEAWVDAMGFGCTRFRPAALPAPTWAPGTWRDMDSRVSAWLAGHGIRMHVHWPSLPHWHDHTVGQGAG